MRLASILARLVRANPSSTGQIHRTLRYDSDLDVMELPVFNRQRIELLPVRMGKDLIPEPFAMSSGVCDSSP
jgi:hypothetical protein